MFNHNSLLDIPLSCPYIPGPIKPLQKHPLRKFLYSDGIIRKGSVLVDRKSEVSRRKSFEEMKQVLKMGMHMCIYPEGTRNRTSEPLKKFYDGAFKLAIETRKSIIPALIFNTKKALPSIKSFYFLPQKLEMISWNLSVPMD